MSHEAMQMALWTLEGWANHDNWVWPESALEQSKRNTIEAITALRQALETEQQPVAWTAMAFARLGEVRDNMRPDDVRIVQQFLDGDYTALRQALVDEPVVGTKTWFEDGKVVTQNLYASDIYKDLPKREWVGLTDEEIDECERLATIRHQRHKYSVRGQIITPADGLEWHFASAIEAKLREKNNG